MRCIGKNYKLFFVPLQQFMKHVITIIVGMLLLAACGQSYEETKRITRVNRQEAWRKDSAALKVAVMPTLDCLPFYVAQYHELFDTLHGGVRLKFFMAQMDCDTALQRGRVEGMVTDLVRAMNLERQGTKMRYVATTNAYWQLITNRNARIRQLKQLDDKMVAMTRFSMTDLLTDRVVDSVKLKEERVFKVQINDVNVRLLMLQNNEMDALWLTEPQATQARLLKNPVVLDSRTLGMQPGVVVFREMEMRRHDRAQQLDLLVKAYNQACDSINKYGFRRYRDLIASRCNIKVEVVDSLPDVKTNRYVHAHGPQQKDITLVEQWLDRKSKGGRP